MSENIKDFIKHLTKDTTHAKCLVHAHFIPAKKGIYSDFPVNISAKLTDYLKQTGIHKLYSHQEQAIDLILKEKNVCVVTPTASGKTLIYNVPVINTILNDLKSKALYVYPLKALAHDQFGTVMEFQKGLFNENHFLASIYDGDTTQYQRQKIKQKLPNILLTNPDMLHLGILPYHSGWCDFFRNLKYIVIDEVHSYRGVFGSHVAHVLRRLRRICNYYGSNPVFIC